MAFKGSRQSTSPRGAGAQQKTLAAKDMSGYGTTNPKRLSDSVASPKAAHKNPLLTQGSI